MNNKRVMGLFVLSLIALSFLASFSSAATDVVTPPANAGAKSVGSSAFNFIVNWWNSSNLTISDTTKGIISKALLMFLVILIVYSLISFIPIFPDNAWIPWTVSIIIGLLSFLFVSLDDIKYIMINYQALGIVLTSILPLLIIIIFTVKLRQSEELRESPIPLTFINKVIIAGFICYLVIKYLTTTYTGDLPEVGYLYPLTILAALVWLFIEKRIAKGMSKMRREARERRAASVTDEATTNIQQQALMQEKLSGAPLKKSLARKARGWGVDAGESE